MTNRVAGESCVLPTPSLPRNKTFDFCVDPLAEFKVRIVGADLFRTFS